MNGEVTLGVYPVHAKEKAFHYSVLAFSHGCISPVLKTAKANSLHWLGSNAANKRETGSTIKPTERIGSYISDRRVMIPTRRSPIARKFLLPGTKNK